MKTTSSFVRQIGFTLLLSILVLRPSTSSAQGPLNPPGPPTPGMKSLDQIEPRTNLQAAPAPAGVDTTNANYHFIIDQPGSYYLSANLAVTKTHGIQINAEGAALDLNGFQIARTSGAGGHGIETVPTAHRSTIRQGTIKGFAYGIRSMQGGGGAFANACAFRELAVSGCTEYAIYAGEGALLESCLVHQNTGSAAIQTLSGASLMNCTASKNTVTLGAIRAGFGSSLSNCVAYDNTGSSGISAGRGSTLTNCAADSNTVENGISASYSSLTNCSAYGNLGSSTSSAGIAAGGLSTLTNCTSGENNSTAASTPTTGMGFDLGPSSIIQGCTANANQGDGIRLFTGAFARDNNCYNNGDGGDGAGIHAVSTGNRIEGNNVSFNNRGIDVDDQRNVIIRNTASGNTTNYALAANNVFGAIVNRTAPASAAVNGNSAPSSAGTTDPWANFSY